MMARPAEHFGPGCTCDTGGEDPQCGHHGYEAVISRLCEENARLREALGEIAYGGNGAGRTVSAPGFARAALGDQTEEAA